MPRGGRREGAGRKVATPNQTTAADGDSQHAGEPIRSMAMTPAERQQRRRSKHASAANRPTDTRNSASAFPLKKARAIPGLPPYRLARVDALVPYANNARTHSPAQIDKLAALITEFGWTNPVLVDGKRGIIAGHGRVLAARKLGLDVVPTIELAHLSAAQRRAYVIADNRSALDAGWDDALLALELGELRDGGFDLALTGFDGFEVDALFGGGTEGLTDPDDVPEAPAEPVTVLGDVWIMGRHRLHCADCMDILPTLSSVDAFVLDPPYSSGGQFRGDRSQTTTTKYVQTDSVETHRGDFAGDNRDQRAFLAWSSMCFGKMLQCGKPGAILCTFTDWRQLPTMSDAVQAGGWVWRNIVTWWKPGIRMQRGRFSSSAEYLIYASNGVPAEGVDSPQNVLSYPPVSGKDKTHIAEKPVALLVDLLGVAPFKAIVVDPFAGSGTTIIAAETTGRTCIAIELSPTYCDVAVRRWQAFTGAPATLEADGRTFDAVSRERQAAAAQAAE
jgi:DNA modification methylase